MYSVKPYYDTNDANGIDLGNTMYSMRSLYQSAAGSRGPDIMMADLLSRQETLISNIEHQILRVDKILTETEVSVRTSAKCGSAEPSNAVTCTSSTPSAAKLNLNWPDIKYPLDIVVHADPTRLPVTPWALRKLLSGSVMIRTHVHSSYKGELCAVEDDYANMDRTNGKIKIIFTLIFRNIKEMEFMVDPVNQMAVSGEANLFRYICRTFPIFPALGVFEETLSDHYIDVICSNLIGAKVKDQQTTLNYLVDQIAQKDGMLVCNKLTPADFCLHAALQKSPFLSLPSSAQKWRRSVAAAF